MHFHPEQQFLNLPSAKVNRTTTSVIYRALPPCLAPSPSIVPAATPSSQIYSFSTSRHKKLFCYLQARRDWSPFLTAFSSSDFYTTKDLRHGQRQDTGRDPWQPACDVTATAGPAGCLPVPVAGADGCGGPDGSRDVPSATGTGKHLTGTCSSSNKAAVKPSRRYFENPSRTPAIYPAFDIFWFSPVFRFLLLGFHSLCLSFS